MRVTAELKSMQGAIRPGLRRIGSARAEGKEIYMRRVKLPSPAMVIACVALIAAIGGSAYAASKINGKDIKRNTVTGKQVKEGSLSTVPSAKEAKRANKADTAKDAKRVGGQKADELKTRWLLLDENGEIEDQSGGFAVIDAYETNSNAYIDAGESLEGKGFSASIAIQNQIDVGGAMPGNTAGEASVTRCQIPGVVECAPDGAKNTSALVVSPRNSDGSAAAVSGSGESTKRVYVLVTE
jgi:hypothetical protein